MSGEELAAQRGVVQAELRALSNEVLISRLRWARAAGLSFDGARDLYQVLGYPRYLTVDDYRARYERGGIAGRIVDVFPNATWRNNPVNVAEKGNDDDDTVTAFEQAWLNIDNRLQVQAKLLRTDKLAGQGNYAVLLIGVVGDSDLTTELPRGRGPQDVIYLKPFSGGGGPTAGQTPQARAIVLGANASIESYEADVTSPRFGLPLTYTLKQTTTNSPAFQRPVHWSRVLHVAENVLEDDVFGQPTLERVWNLLDDLDKVTGGGAEAFWLRANQGLHLDVDKDMALADVKDTLEKLKEQSEAYKHQQTRWLRTRGVSVETLGSDVANFSNPADAVMTQIAGAKGIPKRILTGSEMGELASSQDRDNWRDQVTGRQTGYAGPYIVRPLIDRLVEYGYLPVPKAGADAYDVTWRAVDTQTIDERVKGATSMATVNSTNGSTVFTDTEIRQQAGKEPLTDAQKAEIEEERERKAAAAPGVPEPVPGIVAAEDRELLRVLEDAIRVGNVEVVDEIVGLPHG
jgi:hypothetical protein